ncbi:2-phosphosulfolactate phosphatase [Paludifilum halophilum]|uniref:Probable 2-phosphosulfolactate phosphatase n=1 Tax=Paludifilum halophilum TaxID=1642702 RepID=A0A235BC23_9BACL|nr:2-phosphosulfolactate phosphatase [Paludifilum halophilum]OYD09843.1 hypothetical protein CHM34_02315 [Paludifilum halophilum]
MMVTVVPHVDELKSDQLVHKTIVVIDIFRASSCIITALAHGAAFIRPAETVSEARKLAGKRLLTGGERYGKRLEGFDLGNSPSDYTSDKVNGRGIVMTTTNGTRALIKAGRGTHVLIGGFLNAAACALSTKNLHRDVLLLCAGTRGEFSLEDGVAAGCLLDRMQTLDPSVHCDDLGLALKNCYLSCRERLFETLSLSQSGQRLTGKGLQRDLRDCLQPDRYRLVPRWQEGKIVCE